MMKPITSWTISTPIMARRRTIAITSGMTVSAINKDESEPGQMHLMARASASRPVSEQSMFRGRGRLADGQESEEIEDDEDQDADDHLIDPVAGLRRGADLRSVTATCPRTDGRTRGESGCRLAMYLDLNRSSGGRARGLTCWHA